MSNPPINPENNANIKYNIPISLAFEDKNHLSVHMDIFVFDVCNWFISSFEDDKNKGL